jgi:hypothetical protein
MVLRHFCATQKIPLIATSYVCQLYYFLSSWALLHFIIIAWLRLNLQFYGTNTCLWKKNHKLYIHVWMFYILLMSDEIAEISSFDDHNQKFQYPFFSITATTTHIRHVIWIKSNYRNKQKAFWQWMGTLLSETLHGILWNCHPLFIHLFLPFPLRHHLVHTSSHAHTYTHLYMNWNFPFMKW